MQRSLADRAASIDALTEGFMTPIFVDERTDMNGLGPADFARVRHGYGCPRCLAKYKTYLVECPVCGYLRNIEQDFAEAPGMWVDHLNERHRGDTPHTRTVTADEFLSEVARDPNVEKIEA